MTAVLPMNAHLRRLFELDANTPHLPEPEPELNGNAAFRLSFARDLQQHLLPSRQQLQWSLPKWLDAAVYYQPRHVLSGDFYWSARLGASGFLAVGDTSGSGLPGVLQCVQAQTYLSHKLDTGFRDLPTTIQQLDAYLTAMAVAATHAGDPLATMDFSLVQVRHDRPEVRLAAAAHTPLLVRKGGELQSFPLGKLPLGEGAYQRQPADMQILTLHPGDTLYLCTDGYYGQLTDNKAFSRERLWSLFRRLSQLPTAQAQVEAISREFMPTQDGQRRRADDWTVVVLRVKEDLQLG